MATTNGTVTYTSGDSLNFALKNIIVKDNRIPPRGFNNANFKSVEAAPLAYSYSEGAFSYITHYTVPKNIHHVVVKLMYQSASKEYIKFLRDKNITDNKGFELFNLWVNHVKSTPFVIQEKEFYTAPLFINNAKLYNNALNIYQNPAEYNFKLYFNFDKSKEVTSTLYNLNGSKLHKLFNKL